MPHNAEEEERKLQERMKDDFNRPVLAVDVDGTLSEFKVWRGFFKIDPPKKNIVDIVRHYKLSGGKIVIHTLRATKVDGKPYVESIEFLANWLKEQDIPYDEIWDKPGKPFAHCYLDDRGLRVDCPHCMEILTSGSFFHKKVGN